MNFVNNLKYLFIFGFCLVLLSNFGFAVDKCTNNMTLTGSGCFLDVSGKSLDGTEIKFNLANDVCYSISDNTYLCGGYVFLKFNWPWLSPVIDYKLKTYDYSYYNSEIMTQNNDCLSKIEKIVVDNTFSLGPDYSRSFNIDKDGGQQNLTLVSGLPINSKTKNYFVPKNTKIMSIQYTKIEDPKIGRFLIFPGDAKTLCNEITNSSTEQKSESQTTTNNTTATKTPTTTIEPICKFYSKETVEPSALKLDTSNLKNYGIDINLITGRLTVTYNDVSQKKYTISNDYTVCDIPIKQDNTKKIKRVIDNATSKIYTLSESEDPKITTTIPSSGTSETTTPTDAFWSNFYLTIYNNIFGKLEIMNTFDTKTTNVATTNNCPAKYDVDIGEEWMYQCLSQFTAASCLKSTGIPVAGKQNFPIPGNATKLLSECKKKLQ